MPAQRKVPRRQRRTRTEWIQLMEVYESSELSQRAFCQQHGLSDSNFYNWRRKLRPSEAMALMPLIELPALPITPSSDWRVELALGEGLVLRIK